MTQKIMINNQELDLKDLNRYLTFNSKDISRNFKDIDPFVDLVVTSPPYWDMKNYGDIDGQTGYGQSYDEYLGDIEKTFKGVYDICKDSASLFLIVDTMKRNGKVIRLPDDISKRLEKAGWIHQDIIIWDKGKTLPWSRKGQMRNVFEYIYMFTKGEKYKYYIDRIKTVEELKNWWQDYPERYSPKGKVPNNIWEYYIPTQGSWGTKKDFGEEQFRHACPFPPEMVTRMIKLSTDENDVVFDPYAGTGVFLATAEKLNRRYLGIDTNKEYEKIFKNVTKPLVNEKMLEINQYYYIQDKLQEIMQKSVYKLRILKYANAVLKKMRTLRNKNDNYIANNFLINFALEEKLKEKEKCKNVIGKVKYIMIWKDNDTLDIIRNQVNEVTSKAPFTKYGLIVDIKIITVEEAKELLDKLKYSLFSYIKGNTKSFYSELKNKDELHEMLNSNEFESYSSKDIPILVSNVKVHENDYKILPAEEYKKKGYFEQLKLYKELLVDHDKSE